MVDVPEVSVFPGHPRQKLGFEVCYGLSRGTAKKTFQGVRLRKLLRPEEYVHPCPQTASASIQGVFTAALFCSISNFASSFFRSGIPTTGNFSFF
jgi:hypothetical protein